MNSDAEKVGAGKVVGMRYTLTGDDGKKENAKVRWQRTNEFGSWHENLLLLEKRPNGTDFELVLQRE